MNNWLKGLIAAVIGGVGTADSSWVGLTMGKGMGLVEPTLNWKALGTILLSGAGFSLFAYLKQSPLPSASKTVTATVTKEVTND